MRAALLLAGLAALSGCAGAGAFLSEHEEIWVHAIDDGGRRDFFFCRAKNAEKKIEPQCFKAEFIVPAVAPLPPRP